MSITYVEDQVVIIRRAAERGLRLAHEIAPEMVDIMQHIVDEAERTEKIIEALR